MCTRVGPPSMQPLYSSAGSQLLEQTDVLLLQQWNSMLPSPQNTHALAHAHEHTHTLVLSPGPVLGYIWLLVIISPFVPFTAPVAVKKPSTPGCTSSQDKFNLEVPRADKTRRQHLGAGQGGGNLIPPPAFLQLLHIHIYTLLFLQPEPHPLHSHFHGQRHPFSSLLFFFC